MITLLLTIVGQSVPPFCSWMDRGLLPPAVAEQRAPPPGAEDAQLAEDHSNSSAIVLTLCQRYGAISATGSIAHAESKFLKILENVTLSSRERNR
jgi:hypothetical protein